MASRGVLAEYLEAFLHIEKWRGNVAVTVSLRHLLHQEVKGKLRTVHAVVIQIWKWLAKTDLTAIGTSLMG